jgi:hypothetical protein
MMMWLVVAAAAPGLNLIQLFGDARQNDETKGTFSVVVTPVLQLGWVGIDLIDSDVIILIYVASSLACCCWLAVGWQIQIGIFKNISCCQHASNCYVLIERLVHQKMHAL